MRPLTRFSSFTSQSSIDSYDSSSSVSADEDDQNTRLSPCWETYYPYIERRGFHLDTLSDVKAFYIKYCPLQCDSPGYKRACSRVKNEDALCKDDGLPDNLFRGTRIKDDKRVIVKAVCARSRELSVIRLLSTAPLCDDPRNHTIPVFDIVEPPDCDIAFIVMEEWSAQFPSHICSPTCLLTALRQCIEGVVFMHEHGIAHLDISLRNTLTDYDGHYSFIDFELSRCYGMADIGRHRITGCRGTEVPPELELGGESDPFKVDVWALSILISKACQLSGLEDELTELSSFTWAIRQQHPDARPSAREVLLDFDRMVERIRASGKLVSGSHCH